MWRVFGGGVAAILLCGSPASAGEPWNKPHSPDWSGLYIGANGGHAWSDGYDSNITVLQPNNVPYATGPLPYSVDFEGPFAGGQIGFNQSLGPVVVGVEADIQGANIDGQSTTAFPNPPVIFPFTYQASTSINWFGTVRGRIGLTFDRTLLYFTGGYAYGNVDYDATYFIPQNAAFANLHKSGTQDGYVLGGGVEHRLDNNWSVKLEYQYLNLGSEDVAGALKFANGAPSGETVLTSYDVDFHTVRIGFNYHFGGNERPVPALK